MNSKYINKGVQRFFVQIELFYPIDFRAKWNSVIARHWKVVHIKESLLMKQTIVKRDWELSYRTEHLFRRFFSKFLEFHFEMCYIFQIQLYLIK